jgi:hypothetical protein
MLVNKALLLPLLPRRLRAMDVCASPFLLPESLGSQRKKDDLESVTPLDAVRR